MEWNIDKLKKSIENDKLAIKNLREMQEIYNEENKKEEVK